MITLAQSALAEGNVCCVLMSSQGWRSRATSPPPPLLHTGGLGSRGSVFAVPHNRSSQHPTAVLHTHPSSPLHHVIRAPIPSPSGRLPKCGCGTLFLLPGRTCPRAVGVTVTRASTPMSQSPCRTVLVILHKVRDAQTGPTLIPSIPLTGAVSHLSSALISTHLVFH